ncbi:MAG TPA: GntR family transcriptional regulator [Thermoanaerobaculia bacterium]
MLLRIDPTDATPIWSQIEEGIRRLVASGALKPGAPVPSVRELASELRINPATVARGYQRLAEDGILTVRRGDGTYVADAPPAMSKTEKTRILREGALRYASLAATLGLTEDEAADAFHGIWKKGIPS